MDGFCVVVFLACARFHWRTGKKRTNLQSHMSHLNMQTCTRRTIISGKTGAGRDRGRGARGVRAGVKCTLNYWREATWQHNFNHPKPGSHLGLVKAKGLRQDTLSGYWTEREAATTLLWYWCSKICFPFLRTDRTERGSWVLFGEHERWNPGTQGVFD